jgi:queuine tRNA-ribosyltransferase
MTDNALQFQLEATDGMARATTLQTSRGTIRTPIFMPVGTVGTVKGLTPEEVENLGADIILGNTYHLYLRPGEDVLKKAGGLHSFMQWSGPILTDSGGFQFFSLSHLAETDDDGVTFRSHIDGSKHRFTPERVQEIQEVIGSDIRMVLDECPALPAPKEKLEESMRRSTAWAKRALEYPRSGGALFAILQGGTDADLRRQHREELCALPFDGFALGGLSVGEDPQAMYDTVESCAPEMPSEKPRYLMGVGTPVDLIENIHRGIDMFDCVMPTRNARNGGAFTRTGRLNLRNACHELDERPIDESCACYTCSRFSRSYLRHLIKTNEMLAPQLISIHNLRYYIDLMRGARRAIMNGQWDTYRSACHAGWGLEG